MRPLPPPIVLKADEARSYLVSHLGLTRVTHPPGRRGARALLKQLRCIQLDPLDVLGTNADLVALARVDSLKRQDLYRHLLPGHAFEHFAKERCLLPAEAFSWYRAQAAQTPWWRLGERLKRLPEGVIQRVLAEVKERGPLTAAELTDQGAVEPIDWSGWKGTSKASAMALEVLWTRCEVVVCGREGNRKRYDVPERALPKASGPSTGEFARWALIERVEAAGLLARASGPHWSMLAEARTSPLPDQLIREGELVEVQIEGRSRKYLAPPDFRDRAQPRPDDRMRLLGPLDPLLWDRKLVREAFDFDYVWEVYKPASARRWGWYVCPLLHRGQLVGRLEGRVVGDTLRIDRLWGEKGHRLNAAALDACLERHAAACSASRVQRPRLPR